MQDEIPASGSLTSAERAGRGSPERRRPKYGHGRNIRRGNEIVLWLAGLRPRADAAGLELNRPLVVGSMGRMHGIVRNAGDEFPAAAGQAWDAAPWSGAETLEIASFRPESSDHRPKTLARLLYDARGLHGMFHVEDRYVLCRRTQFQDPVWKDSCVELFIQPKPDCGYFNFEFNCGGALLCMHITDHERTPDAFKKYEKLPLDLGRMVQVRSSLPERIDPEIGEAITWTLQFFIPFALFEQRVGPLGRIQGQSWRGNLFKCVEENSHPHWASWAPVDEFNFHRPNCFGTLSFE